MQKTGAVRQSILALCAGISCAMSAQSVQAQAVNSIFPADMPSATRDRLFMRLGYTSAFIKTKSGEAYDVTGDVMSRADLAAALQRGIDISDPGSASYDPSSPYYDGEGGAYDIGKSVLLGNGTTTFGALGAVGLNGLGTPTGIKAKAGNAGTPTLSVGYWLTEDHAWGLEAFVLAAPLTIKAYGDGVNSAGRPNGISGKHIITTKLLPPLAVLARHFGGKDAVFRPYLGVGAMYAVFFDAKAEQALNSYVGGKTTVSLKNAAGVGPFAGLVANINDEWHVNLSVGQVQLKTTATLTTTGTTFKTGDAVLNDYPTRIATALDRGEQLWAGDPSSGLTTSVAAMVAETRGGTLGTFVRKQEQRFTNTIVTFSVGKSF